MLAKLNRLLLVPLALAVLALPDEARAQVTAEVSFEAELAPYGEWVVVPHHGRVWRPHHRAGWRPYFHGRWVWTSDGWFWDSGEPFGWATYHYGRWYPDPAIGWVWVPGYTWGPAWVSWRFGGGVIGWAPLLPGFSVWWTAGYPVQTAAWVFVPTQRFAGARVEAACFPSSRTSAFLAATHSAPPRAVSGASAPRLGGPPRAFVERQMGRPIAPVRVAVASTPQGARAARRQGTVSVFRPRHVAMGSSHAQAASRPHAAAAPRPHAAAAPRPHGDRTAPRAAAAPRPHGDRTAPRAAAAPRPHGDRTAPRAAAAPRSHGDRTAPHAAAAPRPAPSAASAPRPQARSGPHVATARPRAQDRAAPERRSHTD